MFIEYSPNEFRVDAIKYSRSKYSVHTHYITSSTVYIQFSPEHHLYNVIASSNFRQAFHIGGPLSDSSARWILREIVKVRVLPEYVKHEIEETKFDCMGYQVAPTGIIERSAAPYVYKVL